MTSNQAMKLTATRCAFTFSVIRMSFASIDARSSVAVAHLVLVRRMNAHRLQSFRKSALGTVRASPFIVVACVVLYLFSLPHVPRSVAYQLTAALAGAVSFPILRRHWRKPSTGLFILFVMIAAVVPGIAQDDILRWQYPLPWVWPSLQYLSIYLFVLLSLVFVFRHRMRAFLSDATPPA
jgi:hypothetical protein